MVPQQVSGRLRRRPVSDAGQCSLTSALSARDSQAAQTQGPLPWPAQTLLQPLARPQSQMGQGEPGEGVHKSQHGVMGHSQGWSPQLWSLLTPHALGCASSLCVGRRAPRFLPCILVLPALSVAWPLLCPQQSPSWQTATQQTHWKSSAFWPLCSPSHIWGKALTLMSPCQQPGTQVPAQV